ncbi:MAG TPA: lysozyme inhibitor LprI family protein [Thermoanaerobaculia bacterium]|nr:lysozyme inhibitor LprI family protein [Thermoanaerobaculia bacterium]
MIEILLAAAICAKFENWTPPETCPDDPDNLCHVTLAEKYADARNFDAATYFLCQAEESIAPAEFDGMMEHLQNMRAGKETAPLRFCDHVTSGYGSTYCANVAWDEAMPKLEARISRIGNAELRKRGIAYADAEASRIGEQSKGGTGSSAILLHAEIEQKTRLADTLEALTKKRAPAVTDAEAKAADAELNAAYKAVQKTLDELSVDDEETFAEWKTRLRDAQRAWIAYRDAFATYYAERWKGTAPPEVLRREVITYLTRKRSAELRKED